MLKHFILHEHQNHIDKAIPFAVDIVASCLIFIQLF